MSATPPKPYSASNHECLTKDIVFLGVWKNGVVTRLE